MDSTVFLLTTPDPGFTPVLEPPSHMQKGPSQALDSAQKNKDANQFGQLPLSPHLGLSHTHPPFLADVMPQQASSTGA